MQKMETELHLPWDNDALESLLLKIIQTGEATKVDFKRQLNIGSPEHNAELLKDIAALANTYDHHYKNHGFLILGVTENALTYTSFEQNGDALQARIDDLVKNYIEPFIPTQVRIFSSGERTWGVVVVPPSGTAPHVFVKDLQKRSRGEIFVRRGTTTDKALPADYARFFRLHLDEHIYGLRQDLEDVKRDLASLKREQLSVLSPKLQRRSESAQGSEHESHVTTIQKTSPSLDKPMDLLRVINNTFSRNNDPISDGLAAEAQKIRAFIKSSTIAWSSLQAEKESGKRILDEIEAASSTFWSALASVVYNDDTGKYDEAICKAFSYIAFVPEAPPGTAYSDWGVNVRYLPLVVSLYVVCIMAASKGRYGMLRSLFQKGLASSRSRYEDPAPISHSLFYLRRADEIFQTQYPEYPSQRWCDGVASCIERITQRYIAVDDPIWDRKEAFFVGEFILCLAPMGVLDFDTKTPTSRLPASGAYLYYSEAEPILRKFLKREADNLKIAYDRPLREVLADFDKNVTRLIAPRCLGNGFAAGAVETAFPNSVRKEISSLQEDPAAE